MAGYWRRTFSWCASSKESYLRRTRKRCASSTSHLPPQGPTPRAKHCWRRTTTSCASSKWTYPRRTVAPCASDRVGLAGAGRPPITGGAPRGRAPRIIKYQRRTDTSCASSIYWRHTFRWCASSSMCSYSHFPSSARVLKRSSILASLSLRYFSLSLASSSALAFTASWAA